MEVIGIIILLIVAVLLIMSLYNIFKVIGSNYILYVYSLILIIPIITLCIYSEFSKGMYYIVMITLVSFCTYVLTSDILTKVKDPLSLVKSLMSTIVSLSIFKLLFVDFRFNFESSLIISILCGYIINILYNFIRNYDRVKIN